MPGFFERWRIFAGEEFVMNLVRFEYRLTVSHQASELEALLDQAWEDVQLRVRAEKLGIPLDSLPGKRSEAIAVNREGAGLDPLVTTIVVTFVAPVAKDVALDLWRKLLLPWIEQKWGRNALVPK